MRPPLSHILPPSRGIGGLLPLLLVLLASCSEWDTDSLGTSFTPANSVVRVYNNLGEQIIDSVGNYISDVKSGDFPNADEQY